MFGLLQTAVDAFVVEVSIDGGSPERQRWQRVGSRGLELVGKEAQSFYRNILTSSVRVAPLQADESVPDLRLVLLCSDAGPVLA